MRPKLFLFAALVALPAVLVVGVGAAYVAARVPGWIRAEPGRVTREYRESAEDLLAHPEKASYAGPRVRGWRQTGRVSGRPWGYVAGPERTLVWVKVGEAEWRAVSVAPVRPVPYALVFYGGGAVVAAVLVALTALAVWSLLRFLREHDDFLAATAHDLTTPLVALRFAVGRDEAEARRLVERLLLVVDNLKAFLRLGGRRRAPQPRHVDLAALAREAYALFAADYRDCLDGADVPVEADGPVLAWADETMALQILWNLFGNDLKNAAPHGPVAVSVRAADGWAVVSFADRGQGMTARQMRRAFDRYYRAKTVLVTGKGGFGIGLCTSREFARAMGGDLSVRANEPSGCVFTLRLPAAPH